MLSELRTGPVVSTDGAVNPGRAGKSGEFVVSDAHGRYLETTYRGNVFFAASQAAITFSTTITTTTAIGFILSNPPGSSKLLVPLQLEFLNTGVIAGSVGISAMGYSATAVTHTTALTIKNAYLGSSLASVGNADTGATLPIAPLVAKLLFGVLSTNTAVINQAAIYDLGGSLVLPQGTAIAVLATAAVTGFIGCTWEEIPA